MTRNTNRASNLLESTKYFGIYETIILHSWNCNIERKVKVQTSMTEAQKAKATHDPPHWKWEGSGEYNIRKDL